MKLLTILLVAFILPLSVPAQTKTEKNLNAKGVTTYYSLETGKIVKETEKWDLAFNNTTIKVNSGVSGSGKVTATVLSGTSFDKVTRAPTSGLKQDTQGASAIPPGSGNGWYTYDMGTHVLEPIAGRVIIVKTNSGRVAKLEILSYYYNQDEGNDTGFYTFRYAFL